MATYNKTGTAGNDSWSFANVGGQPSNNNIYNLNGAAGTDSFRFDDGLTSTKYIGRFLSTNFTIGAAVGGVITVTGASTGGTNLTFNLTSVETLVFGDKTVTLTYSQPNLYPPVFTSGGTGTVAENSAVSTVIYTATATDADGTTPTYSLSGTDASLLNINATNGQVTLITSANYETKTSYSFNVIAGDGTNNTSKAVVVSVTNQNDNAPQFTSGGSGMVATKSPAGTLVYTAVANDADNLLALVYSLSGTDASLLNINTTTGAVTLKSAADFATKPSYSFNVIASDGTNNTSKAVVVSVTNQNDNAPVFTSGGTGTVAENAATSTVIYTATATDADGTTPTYSLSGTDASLLNINATNGQVTLITSANYETKTSYSFNVIAGDGTNNTSKAVVVSVTNQNDNAPQFTSGGSGMVATKSPAGTLVYTAVANDADNLLALVYSLSGTDASLLNINTTTGAVTLKSAADFATKPSYSFNVIASDGTNNTSKAIFVNVQAINNFSPVFTSGGTGTVVENAATSTVIYKAAATDADGNTLTYLLSGTDAALLNIDAVTGVVTLKTAANYETKTSYSFNVVASDGVSAHDVTKSVVVSVTNVNDTAPVFTSGGTGTVSENAATSTVIYTATATDADNLGALTYSLSGTDASLLNINTTAGAVTLKSTADFATKPSYSFNVVASDGSNTTSKAVLVNVQAVNDYAPVFTSGGTGTVVENAATSTVIYTAVATDADGNNVTYSLAGTDAPLLNINSATGAVTLKTSADYETKTNYSFGVVASDGTNNTTKAVLVGVTNMNEPPVSSNDSVATHDTVTRVLGIDDFGVYSDPENSPLGSIKIVSLPSSSSGRLQFYNGSSWSAITNGQNISSADIAAGHVRFVPVVGMTSAGIGFLVNDGSLYSDSLSPYTLTVYAEQVQTVSAGAVQAIGTTGITVTVPAYLTLFSDSLPTNSLDLHDRIASFTDQLVTDLTGHEDVHTAIDTFVSGLSDPSSVIVREFELQADASFNTSDHVIIDGSVTAHEALVIDASHLPSGTFIDLNNVEFAVIIGPALLGGGSGSNIVVGDRASQYILLGAGEDLIDGGAGNDTIGSRAGNDTLIGGDGDDTALFNGDFSNYSISYDEATDTYTVVDTIGTDGTDTVTGFEHFQFADGTRLPQDSIDVIKPTVQTFTPPNNANGVGIAENIVLKFSEAVHLETGLIQIHSDSASGTVFESFDAGSSTRLMISGDTLTIDPTANLANGTSYYVTFADGSIQDYAGNHYAGTDAYHFSTVAAAVSASGGSSGSGGGAIIAGAAALGILAWILF
jgi:type III secretion system FlhB-like substrate exporter